MNFKSKSIVVMAVFGFLLIGCGSSGSSGGGGEPTQTTNGGNGGEGTAKPAYLLYKSGSISTVDISNPTVQVIVEPGATTGEVGIVDGTFNATNMKVMDPFIHTIIYAKSNGRLYKVRALKNNSLTPSQISNETGAATNCDNNHASSDFANHNNSVYLYKLPGPDSTCKTNDDIWRMVRVGMNATDSPIPAKELIETLYNKATGAIIGFLAIDKSTLSTLVHCDQNFLNCATVSTFNSEVEKLGETLDFILFRIDTKVYAFDISTKTLTPPLYTLIADPSSSSSTCPPNDSFCIHYDNSGIISASDSSGVYIINFGILYYWTTRYDSYLERFSKNGNSYNVDTLSIFTASGARPSNINFTTNNVVYSYPSGGLTTVSKKGGSPTLLFPDANSKSLYTTAGSRIYYSENYPSSGVGVVNEDGTYDSKFNGGWVGYTISAFSGADREISKIMRVDNGTLVTMDVPANTNNLVLGAIPSDMGISFYGFGENILGLGSNNTNKDIFYANTSRVNSLVRVTNTPTPGESLIPWHYLY